MFYPSEIGSIATDKILKRFFWHIRRISMYLQTIGMEETKSLLKLVRDS